MAVDVPSTRVGLELAIGSVLTKTYGEGCVFKRFVRDIFSPSNLWTLAQTIFPGASAVVSGWLSILWKLSLPTILLQFPEIKFVAASYIR